jgi:adenosylmethionine-8-amino-7-oxononanoate aminotransferase
MVGLELVADRETRQAFPRASRVVEGVVRVSRERGVLLYSGTGCADGIDGDVVVLGPPFVVTEAEIGRVVDVVAEAIEVSVADAQAVAG